MTDQPPMSAPGPSDPAAPRPATPVLSILSLVLGLVGLLTGWVFIGFLPAVAGIVLGFVARRREPGAKGMWLTGIITGFVGVAEILLWLALYLGAILVALGDGAAG